MGDSPPTKPDLVVSSQEARADAQASKKRKVAQKTVVTVKIETSSAGKQKGEGPPSDSWSWRKYGQKPIKGSPYPRGYYKCSTSKGCSAKKQVERCRTDPSVLIITYTSEHNHPSTATTTTSTTTTLHSAPTGGEAAPTTDGTGEPTKVAAPACEEEDGAAGDGYLRSQSPPKSSHGDVPADSAAAETDKIDDHVLLNTSSEEGTGNSSAEPTKSAEEEEEDIFDELEELPVSSSFTRWVRSSSFDDRVLPLPIPLLDY